MTGRPRAPAAGGRSARACEKMSRLGFTNLVDLAPAGQRYSFMFDGNAQELDHMLVTQSVLGGFHDIQWGRSNADFP